jgi:hypothetical protein
VSWLGRGDAEAEKEDAARRFLLLMARCGTLSAGGSGAGVRELEARETLAGDSWLAGLDAAYAAKQRR